MFKGINTVTIKDTVDITYTRGKFPELNTHFLFTCKEKISYESPEVCCQTAQALVGQKPLHRPVSAGSHKIGLSHNAISTMEIM